MEKERQYFPICEQTARGAKMVNSFSDYVPGSATAEYRKSVDAAYDEAERQIQKGLTESNAERVWGLAISYARRLADWKNRYNRNRGSVPSVMISGASNFPVHRKEKQNAREGRLWKEYNEIKGLLDKITNIGYSNQIKSGDPNALEMLEARIADLTHEQEEMKHANAHYRKHGTMAGYVTKSGLPWTDKMAEEYDKAAAGDFHKQPYPKFALTNNAANIRRIKDRVESIKKDKEKAAAGGATYQTHGICEVVEDEADMRIRLIFPGKPDEATRSVLKRNGFVWSNKNTAWQRQLNNNGRYAVRRVLEILGGGQ